MPQQRRRHHLPLAGRGAGDQRGADTGGGGHAGAVVAHAAPLERRRPAGLGEEVGDAGAGPERADVVGGPVALGPVEAEAGERAVDQARVAVRQCVPVEAEPLESGQPHVGEEDVSAVDELERDGATVVGREIDDNAALAAVVELERRVERDLAAEHVHEAARGVPVATLDLHDVRAPVGQDAAGRRARDPDAELHHLDARERPRAERRGLLAGLVVGLVPPRQPVENPARSLGGQAAPFSGGQVPRGSGYSEQSPSRPRRRRPKRSEVAAPACSLQPKFLVLLQK